jgi:TonB family protein
VIKRDRRFWMNVALVAVAHLAILLALARGSRDESQANLQNVVWMSGEVAAAAEPKSTPAPTVAHVEKPVALSSPTPFKSEIHLPSPTPTATIAPKPSPTPSPTPKSSAKPSPSPSPKATPKKSAEPKATAKPSPKATAEKKPTPEKKPTETKKKEESISSAKETAEKKEGADKGSGNTTTQPSELAWYGTMLHDRFHKAWDQPKSSVPTGAKMSTIVRIRIEKDGRVSKFAIVKPSGNVVVDESVTAIAQRVTHVDPLPEGLAQKGYYEVKIDFELNAEK